MRVRVTMGGLACLAAMGATACAGKGKGVDTAPRDRRALYSDELPHGGGHVAMGDRVRGASGAGPMLRAREVHPDPAVFVLVPTGPRPAFPADVTAARAKLHDLERTLLDSPRNYQIDTLDSAGESNLDALLGATPDEASPFVAVRKTGVGKELYLLKPTEAAVADWKKGEEAFERGDHAAARAAFEAVLKRAPELPRALVYLGRIAEATGGGAAAAIPLYRRALAVNPVDADAHRRLAEALLATGEPAAGTEEILRALLFSPRNVWAWARLSELSKDADVAAPRFEPSIRVELRRDGSVTVDYFDDGTPFAVPYAMCKAAMRYEPALWRDATGLSGPYVRSVMEEEYCLRIVLAYYVTAREEAGSDSVPAIPYLEHLLRVEAAGMLRQFVLFDVVGARAAHRLALLPDDEQERVLDYLRKFATHGPSGGGSDV